MTSTGAVICEWELCGRVFEEASALPSHLLQDHVVRSGYLKQYKCCWKSCNEIFTSKTHFTRHVKTHVCLNPFVCSKCLKAFSKHENLKIHFRIHTGEKPFQCRIVGCARRYRSSCDRDHHEKMHDPNIAFVCPWCSKSYTDPGSLRRHKRLTNHQRQSNGPSLPIEKPIRRTGRRKIRIDHNYADDSVYDVINDELLSSANQSNCFSTLKTVSSTINHSTPLVGTTIDVQGEPLEDCSEAVLWADSADLSSLGCEETHSLHPSLADTLSITGHDYLSDVEDSANNAEWLTQKESQIDVNQSSSLHNYAIDDTLEGINVELLSDSFVEHNYNAAECIA